MRVRVLDPEFVSGEECDRLFGTTPEIRKNLRASGDWYAPVHYQHLNGRVFLYRVVMVRSFIQNRHQPEVHLADGEKLLRTLQPVKLIPTAV
jgi:hypothetical protein